jgi:hypothetical protein
LGSLRPSAEVALFGDADSRFFGRERIACAIAHLSRDKTAAKMGHPGAEAASALVGLGEDFGEVHGFGVGVLGDLFGAAEAVGDEDGVGGFVACGGEEDALA